MEQLRVFWLTKELKDEHKKRAKTLLQESALVRFFHSFDEISQALLGDRVEVVVLDDSFEDTNLIASMHNLSYNPLVQGSRLILSQNQPNSDTSEMALSMGFKDILPFGLPEDQWLTRFLFASHFEGRRMGREPLSPFAQPNPCRVSIPVRINWINGDQI
ncbi:MAG: hypothetical protein HRU19_10380 [Pseudobacteriovorax sp.]|nr:hypothetical protein [Pseudobacteriovorax sp.]